MGINVNLKNVRIAFCQSIWKGQAEDYQGNKNFRHSATFLVEPGSGNDKALQAAILESAKATWPKKAQAMVDSLKPQTNKYPYHSGDLKDYDGFQGMMALGAHRKQSDGQPLIIDRDKTPLTAADGRIYAGCYVNAIVEIYAQEGQNAGIRCGLKGIQFVRDGDSFGGATKAKDDDFEDLGVDAEEEEDLA